MKKKINKAIWIFLVGNGVFMAPVASITRRVNFEIGGFFIGLGLTIMFGVIIRILLIICNKLEELSDSKIQENIE